MLAATFNRFKNRQLLRKFETKEGSHKAYSLNLEITPLPPSNAPGFKIGLKEIPWGNILLATQQTLVNADDISKTLEQTFYAKTGKAFDVFVKPEGSQHFYTANSPLLGLAQGRHHILLLPKGALPEQGTLTMTPKEPRREAGDIQRPPALR